MSLLHPWLQRRVQITPLPRATKLLRKCGYNIDSSQSATYQSGKRKTRQCHICPSLWIAKQLTNTRNAMSRVVSITNKSRFYAFIVQRNFCALVSSSLLYLQLETAIALMLFFPFLLNFEVQQHINSILCLFSIVNRVFVHLNFYNFCTKEFFLCRSMVVLGR